MGNEIAPITNEIEIGAVEEAMSTTVTQALAGANEHLKSALEKLSDKKNPDYRNSVKESISAVESVCKVITQDHGVTLGKALAELETEIDLHPCLKRGYGALYDYTSDADGIRHAMTETSGCDSTDARYMLVSCSAFVNYLVGKATKAGLLK